MNKQQKRQYKMKWEVNKKKYKQEKQEASDKGNKQMIYIAKKFTMSPRAH